jgi:hypothetical protein
MTKKKLAICITGQTRSYEEYKEAFHNDMETLFGDYEYHLYAHTWDDQILPIDQTPFTQIETTDQTDIWTRLCEEDPFSAMRMTAGIRNSQEYKNALAGKGDMVELMKTITMGTYAQIVSTYQAMNMAPIGYDGYVKFRWDISHQDQSSAGMIQQWKEVFNKFITKSHPQQHLTNTDANVLIAGNVIVKSNSTGLKAHAATYIQDMMLTFSPAAHTKMIENNIHMTINDMAWKRLLGVHSSHELWSVYFKYLDIAMISSPFDNIIGFNNAGVIDHHLKTNKKWNL